MKPIFTVVAKIADLDQKAANELQEKFVEFLIDSGFYFKIVVSVEQREEEEENE